MNAATLARRTGLRAALAVYRVYGWWCTTEDRKRAGRPDTLPMATSESIAFAVVAVLAMSGGQVPRIEQLLGAEFPEPVTAFLAMSSFGSAALFAFYLYEEKIFGPRKKLEHQ